ncbi:hypothetical protein EXIGLDRAFT_779276 [Exidia glandulosa HHB12029]|uniref:Uncharacterized protein n=1 Tax=Exidia glandulosa HHB12029 TaxID=1314781 RepID=A0A165C502_EXIGL|nr:hypothetical protein EXIGLDRAFT_779276 [Exidia glandulosa HHB12029]
MSTQSEGRHHAASRLISHEPGSATLAQRQLVLERVQVQRIRREIDLKRAYQPRLDLYVPRQVRLDGSWRQDHLVEDAWNETKALRQLDDDPPMLDDFERMERDAETNADDDAAWLRQNDERREELERDRLQALAEGRAWSPPSPPAWLLSQSTHLLASQRQFLFAPGPNSWEVAATAEELPPPEPEGSGWPDPETMASWNNDAMFTTQDWGPVALTWPNGPSWWREGATTPASSAPAASSSAPVASSGWGWTTPPGWGAPATSGWGPVVGSGWGPVTPPSTPPSAPAVALPVPAPPAPAPAPPPAAAPAAPAPPAPAAAAEPVKPYLPPAISRAAVNRPITPVHEPGPLYSFPLADGTGFTTPAPVLWRTRRYRDEYEFEMVRRAKGDYRVVQSRCRRPGCQLHYPCNLCNEHPAAFFFLLGEEWSGGPHISHRDPHARRTTPTAGASTTPSPRALLAAKATLTRRGSDVFCGQVQEECGFCLRSP